MDFEWTVPRMFKDLREKNYINPCCVGCDEILNQLKPEIAARMNVDENSITIYQEDWGWALEFSKGEVDYLLAVSNSTEAEIEETLFSAYTDATRREKGFFFDKNVEAIGENENFSSIVAASVEKNGFK
jgi:hypothetical protein